MAAENWFVVSVLLAAAIFYFYPTLVAARRRHSNARGIAVFNLVLGWTIWGWIKALVDATSPEKAEAAPHGVSSSNPQSEGPYPEHQFAGLVARLIELPPAERVLSLRTGGGHEIQLARDSERPLTLCLSGAWTETEEADARDVMEAAASSTPDLARLVDPENPTRGVVFTTENQFSASDLIYRLATDVLDVAPAELTVDKNYDDHDSRPKIVAVLETHHSALILHEESGVRVIVHRSQTGYRLEVPTASLDPRRGQRHRAHKAISDAGWRLYEAETGAGPFLEGSVDDPATTWGYKVDNGDSKTAANAALRLLCAIGDLPIDVEVSVLPRPTRDRGPAEH